MQEIPIKTHLIIKDIHDEYNIDWFGKIKDTKPLIKNGKPIFIIISRDCRIELNTINIKEIEKVAKANAIPHGNKAVTTGISRIYIKEIDGKEKLIGKVTKFHIKTFAQMYDKVGWQ